MGKISDDPETQRRYEEAMRNATEVYVRAWLDMKEREEAARLAEAVLPRRLVWSEVKDLLDVAGVASVGELIVALEQYQADPPLPNEPIDEPEHP